MFPEFEVKKIKEGFWAINQGGVRCFLAEGTEKALLVDAGFGGNLKTLCETLTEKPLELIITHADPDHVGAAGQFDGFYMHPAEFTTMAAKHGSAEDAVSIWEGDIIDLGGFRFEVVLLSGHTPGSIGLLEREKRFLIAGDTVQSTPVYMFGSHRSVPAYRAAIKKLMTMTGDFDTIYCSHGEISLGTEILADLHALAGDICRGDWPEESPAPAHLPETVQIYGKGPARFYLEKPEK